MAAHGIALRHRRPGRQRLACPRCDKGKNDTALRVYISADGIVFGRCYRCDWRVNTAPTTPNDAGELARLRDRRRREGEAEQAARTMQARALWLDACPLEAGSLGSRYLEARGLD